MIILLRGFIFMVVVVELGVFALAEAFARLFEVVELPWTLRVVNYGYKLASFDFYDRTDWATMDLVVSGRITDETVICWKRGEDDMCRLLLSDPGCFDKVVRFISRVEIGR